MKFSSNFAVVMKTSSLQLPSLAGTLSIKSMLQSAPKHVIFILKFLKITKVRKTSQKTSHFLSEEDKPKIQKFSEEGTQLPPQTPPPVGGGHPVPHPLPSVPAAPRSSRLRRSLTHPPLGSLATGLMKLAEEKCYDVTS